MPVAPNSRQYKRYKCRQSEQYVASITCKFTETKNGTVNVITILHLNNNIVTYINKSISPAAFTKSEVDGELKRLSGQFGSSPRIKSSPHGVIATWGEIKLERLPQSDLASLARTKTPNSGFMVDYLNEFSANRLKPASRFTAWAGARAMFGSQGSAKIGVKGALRFLAADPSQMKLNAPETAKGETMTAQNRTRGVYASLFALRRNKARLPRRKRSPVKN